MLKNRIS